MVQVGKSEFNEKWVEWIHEIGGGFVQSIKDLEMMLQIHSHGTTGDYKIKPKGVFWLIV